MSVITDILKEIPLSAVLKERLTEAEAKMAALEKENAVLNTENQNLRVDLQQARDEIERLKKKPTHPGIWGSQPRIKGRMEP
jgi:regulator of replication initiation timing